MNMRPKPPDLRGSYDRKVDVLHLAIGNPAEVEGDGLPNGVELDFATKTGAPCGVTIIGFHRNGWAERLRELAQIVARHLSLDERDTFIRIEEIVVR